MEIQIKGPIPEKAHPNDIGWDLIASEPTIRGDFLELPTYFPNTGKLYSVIQYIQYDTGISVAPPEEYWFSVVPRSSISQKNLVLINSPATIDQEYRGNILLRYKYLPDPADMVVFPDQGITKIYFRINPEKIYKNGEKLAQLILHKNINFKWQQVEVLNATERGTKSFGSSGK